MSKLQTPNDLMSSNHLVIGSSTSLLFLPFYENSDSDPIDEFQLQDQLAFLNDGSPTSTTLAHKNNSDMFYPFFKFASRKIYLNLLADSTFREEDVSNYFSIYGPVQDVRIPYHQKRI
ncbi:hypothetical protein GYH30_018751 [Glycine max]|uniref:RRM domain-containing protein n=2 Tax=Glycine subgen. Soja TaxID=1462606 RepID=K7L2E3_SOYBN|nr:hypothetical protein GYH30_018751 [Glycine max]RZC03401.1 Zinc finger CCCH domain-containing protein 22 [Glycine soja]